MATLELRARKRYYICTYVEILSNIKTDTLHPLVCHELAHPRPILDSRACRTSLRSQGESLLRGRERNNFFDKEYEPRLPNMEQWMI